MLAINEFTGQIYYENIINTYMAAVYMYIWTRADFNHAQSNYTHNI